MDFAEASASFKWVQLFLSVKVWFEPFWAISFFLEFVDTTLAGIHFSMIVMNHRVMIHDESVQATWWLEWNLKHFIPSILTRPLWAIRFWLLGLLPLPCPPKRSLMLLLRNANIARWPLMKIPTLAQKTLDPMMWSGAVVPTARIASTAMGSLGIMRSMLRCLRLPSLSTWRTPRTRRSTTKCWMNGARPVVKGVVVEGAEVPAVVKKTVWVDV